ncbi:MULTISPECIES: hypothetical protein [Cupriavidus]
MRLVFSYLDGGAHPAAGRVFYWHPIAVGGVDAPRCNRYVCGALGAIAQTIEDCDRLLSFLSAVEGGREQEIETGGNDVTLTLTRGGVQVDIEANEDWVGTEEGHFSLREWELILEGWKRFLVMPQAKESTVEVFL